MTISEANLDENHIGETMTMIDAATTPHGILI